MGINVVEEVFVAQIESHKLFLLQNVITSRVTLKPHKQTSELRTKFY